MRASATRVVRHCCAVVAVGRAKGSDASVAVWRTRAAGVSLEEFDADEFSGTKPIMY